MTKQTRRTLHALGLGKRRVLVYQDRRRKDGERRIVVQWKDWDSGSRKYAIYPATTEGRTEAIAFAAGVYDTLGVPKALPPITMRELWDAYAEIELPRKKHRTRDLYTSRWRKWELFTGRTQDPNLTTVEQVERFRVEMTKKNAPNQVMQVLRVVKVVFNWGQRLEKISINKLASYRFQFGSDEAANEPPEYTPEEFRKLVAAIGEPTRLSWRLFALIVMAGTQGFRIRALLHLRWVDVDLEGGRIQWDKRYDKKAKGRWQAMVPDARVALQVADVWRQIEGYTGEFVFFSQQAGQKDRKDGTYDLGVYRYQSACRLLHQLEVRAGVEPIKGRGFHGLRKLAAGNALEVFGNPKDALDWIGDTDPRRLKEYAKKRDAHERLVAEGLGGSAGMLSKNYPTPAPSERAEVGSTEGVAVPEDAGDGSRATGRN